MQVIKDKTYQQFEDGKNTGYIFNYLLTEYHFQPSEFIDLETQHETAADLLKRIYDNGTKDFAKKEIDDFFCDHFQRRRKMWNYIEHCSLDVPPKKPSKK